MELGAGFRVSNVSQQATPYLASNINQRSLNFRIAHPFRLSNASFHSQRVCSCKAIVGESSNVEAIEKVKSSPIEFVLIFSISHFFLKKLFCADYIWNSYDYLIF